SGHPLTHHFAVFGYHVTGSTGTLFLYGIVVGALGLLGLSLLLAGGWVATRVFHTHTLHGFFNLSTWLTAIAGAAVLLLIFHLISARSTGSSRSRRFAHR
ncbi:MAG TPA: GlsB/YeaQ/YmgE family stress response membrane protein, partial [Streptosporangiaceae bacterium]|nr:GlsB/YeaQ/YmgE family stress response membrane protein [Streptosporangiaceae bacterium]